MKTLLALGAASAATATTLATDLPQISRSWGQLSAYADNEASYFGVHDVGVPEGCGLEQAHLLQRHAQRFGTGVFDDADNDARFARKVAGATNFTGPLGFLNRYAYTLSESYLTGVGAATEFSRGVAFWNRYGRLLYNATAGQTAYNASSPAALAALDAQSRPVLRTTSQSRIWNSQVSWSLGFFGPSFRPVADVDPTLGNWTAPFDVVVVPEGGRENNTLAAYDSCTNDASPPLVDLGDRAMWPYVARYLGPATTRLQAYAPVTLTANDTYAMQSLCAYETAYLGESAFCSLFTADEWAGFEGTLDGAYYYDYSFGNPTGRAQGIGYVQELLARLQRQYITHSNSSVNASLTDNAADFPLGAKFYADFSHDDIIISALTAMSMDYFKDPPRFDRVPPRPDRRFVLSHMTPFGANLVAEVYGCASASPAPAATHTVAYSNAATGYDAAHAPHKFLRLRLNNGILPVHTIRGGACAGRSDGLCAVADFVQSQANATALANYQYACFGNYTEYERDFNFERFDDGTIFETG